MVEQVNRPQLRIFRDLASFWEDSIGQQQDRFYPKPPTLCPNLVQALQKERKSFILPPCAVSSPLGLKFRGTCEAGFETRA